jgi:hypothetical protein
MNDDLKGSIFCDHFTSSLWQGGEEGPLSSRPKRQKVPED